MLHARRQCMNRQRTTTTTWPTGGDRRGITTTSVDRHYKGVRHVVVRHASVLAIGMFFFQVVLTLFLTNHFCYILIFTMTRNHRWETLFISSYCMRRRLGQHSTTQQCMTMTTVTRPPLAELNLHSTRRLWWMVNSGWYYNSEDERWGRLAQTRIGII